MLTELTILSFSKGGIEFEIEFCYVESRSVIHCVSLPLPIAGIYR